MTPYATVLTNIRIPLDNEDVVLIFSVFRYDLSDSFEPTLSTEDIRFGWFTPSEAAQKLKAQYPIEFITSLENFRH